MKISYKITFIDSFRFMPSSLTSLVDTLSEGLHSDKCTDCKSLNVLNAKRIVR